MPFSSEGTEIRVIFLVIHYSKQLTDTEEHDFYVTYSVLQLTILSFKVDELLCIPEYSLLFGTIIFQPL